MNDYDTMLANMVVLPGVREIRIPKPLGFEPKYIIDLEEVMEEPETLTLRLNELFLPFPRTELREGAFFERIRAWLNARPWPKKLISIKTTHGIGQRVGLFTLTQQQALDFLDFAQKQCDFLDSADWDTKNLCWQTPQKTPPPGEPPKGTE